MDAPCALIPMTVEEAALANERFSGNEGMARITHERLVGLHEQLKVKQEADKAASPREHDDGRPTRHQGTQPELDSASTLLTTTTQRYLEFRATFTKTSVLVLWMALMRRMFEELLAIHQELDRVVSLGRLDDPRVATYVDDLKAARSAEEADISGIVRSQTLPFVRNVRGHEAMEALTLMKFEIDYYCPPYNSKTHWESMKTVFFSIVRSSTGRVSKIPDWFTPPYLVTYNKDKVLRASEANAIAKTFRGRYADQKVHRPTTADVIVKLFELEVDGIEPFRREAEQWFKMDSPHVVKLLAASHCSSPALLVVEDVKGVTLKQYLSDPDRFHEIWAKVRQVAEGLVYLRKQRMVHGNLKPSNLLVDKNGTAKVGDFGRGIATLQNLVILVENGESFMRWRAPEYRSPNQRPTYMSDVYSLGLCILDMLVPNFEPPHDRQLQRPNGIKDDAWSLVAQMCAFKPTDRIDLSEVIEKLKLLDKASVKVLVRNIPSEPDIPGNSVQIIPISSATIQRGHIGEGSHAYIYRADWKGAEIVAKCVPIKSVADKQAFDREMSIWSKVQSHPHVLPLYGISESDSQCIAFCEFAAGGSLDKYLSNNGKARIWQKLLQAAIGLKHLHTHDVIHNDVKCNNFMVRGDGQVMIADFDLSLRVNEPPPQVANLNPRWRAPECIVEGGAGPSFASDVYSLGMCILEAITGKAPWGRLLDPAIRYHLKNQEPLKRPSAITDAEWELVSAMIKYEPEERITLDDVVNQLEQLANAEEFPSTQTS